VETPPPAPPRNGEGEFSPFPLREGGGGLGEFMRIGNFSAGGIVSPPARFPV